MKQSSSGSEIAASSPPLFPSLSFPLSRPFVVAVDVARPGHHDVAVAPRLDLRTFISVYKHGFISECLTDSVAPRLHLRTGL